MGKIKSSNTGIHTLFEFKTIRKTISTITGFCPFHIISKTLKKRIELIQIFDGLSGKTIVNHTCGTGSIPERCPRSATRPPLKHGSRLIAGTADLVVLQSP